MIGEGNVAMQHIVVMNPMPANCGEVNVAMLHGLQKDYMQGKHMSMPPVTHMGRRWV